MNTTNDTAQLDRQLNEMILSGQALDAFERFYADDVVMQEGSEAPRQGKPANREYEQQYHAAIAEFHGAELHNSAIAGDTSYSEWTFDATLTDGTRITNTQVAARKWRDGKVVWERFYVA
jgi:ketosteroid isomerase-like protein